MEDSALGRQLESSERRAMARCPEYDATNIYWKRVDLLIDEQDSIRKRWRQYSETSYKNVEVVSSSLNVPSPEKATVPPEICPINNVRN